MPSGSLADFDVVFTEHGSKCCCQEDGNCRNVRFYMTRKFFLWLVVVCFVCVLFVVETNFACHDSCVLANLKPFDCLA